MTDADRAEALRLLESAAAKEQEAFRQLPFAERVHGSERHHRWRVMEGHLLEAIATLYAERRAAGEEREKAVSDVQALSTEGLLLRQDVLEARDLAWRTGDTLHMERLMARGLCSGLYDEREALEAAVAALTTERDAARTQLAAVQAERDGLLAQFTEACPTCGGQCWWSHSAHACDGTEASCMANCPVEEQVRCETCNATGRVDRAAKLRTQLTSAAATEAALRGCLNNVVMSLMNHECGCGMGRTRSGRC